MEVIWPEKADEILCAGFPLDFAGVRNWGLTRSQALIVIEELGAEGIAVFGGDVYERVGESTRPTSDGWHCEREPNEEWEEFVKRTVGAARDYISRYRLGQEGGFWFAIVPGCPSASEE